MAQSLSKLYVHIIFHVKSKTIKIKKEDQTALYSYMAMIIKDNESIPIIINGVEDHVHILCVMSKNIALAKLVEEIKRHSSRWIKTKGTNYLNFAWQTGYAGFSVSSSLHDKTKMYIEKQEKHHQRLTFKDEYLLFLKEYGIAYKKEYIWIE